jgi:hypothetical protein
VKRYFEIKPYVSFDKTQFYTIEEVGKGINETDEFFIRFKDDPDYQKDIETISYWIQKIGNTGALLRHFRPEKKGEAIPIDVSKLRLYCYRISDELVILGNGGIKSSQKVQDSPDAFPSFEMINTVAFVIQMKLENDQIEIAGKSITGDLTFFIK